MLSRMVADRILKVTRISAICRTKSLIFTKDSEGHMRYYHRRKRHPLFGSFLQWRRTGGLTKKSFRWGYMQLRVGAFTLPAPTLPRIPTSSPFFTDKSIPSRVGSTLFFDHEKSAFLIHNTCDHHQSSRTSFIEEFEHLIANAQRRFLDQFTSILLEFILSEERREARNGNYGFNDVWRHLTNLRKHVQRRLQTRIVMWLTIARGNCRSINKEIAGNMMSDVSGFEEVAAATANELKATSRGTPLHSAELHAFW